MPLLTYLMAITDIPFLPSNVVVGRWAVIAVGSGYLLWNRRIVPGPAHWLGLALFAWMALGLLWTPSRWETYQGLLQFIMAACVFCVSWHEDDLTNCWVALALGVTVSAVFALAWEPHGLFLSKNMAAEIGTLALVGAVGLSFRGWHYLALIPGPVIVIAKVHSRESILVLALAAIVAVILSWRQSWKAFAWIALGCAPMTFWLGLHGYLGRYDDRLAIWKIIAAHTHLRGDGLGALIIAAPGLEGAYSEFLQYAFELGIGSILLWAIFAYALGTNKTLEKVALAALLAQCLFWFPLHLPTTVFIGAMLAGHLSGVRDRAGWVKSLGRVDHAPSLYDERPVGPAETRETRLGSHVVSPGPQYQVGT